MSRGEGGVTYGRRGPDGISCASALETARATCNPLTNRGLTRGWATTWSSASTLSSSRSARYRVIGGHTDLGGPAIFLKRAGFGCIAPSLLVPYLLLGSEGRPVAFSYRPAFRLRFLPATGPQMPGTWFLDPFARPLLYSAGISGHWFKHPVSHTKELA